MRIFSDDEYSSLSFDDVINRLQRLNSDEIPESREEAIALLKIYERTRSIKMWHDHSSILNHSYASFMVSWVYEKANYLTNEEYREMYPNRKPVNVQAVVERPKLYQVKWITCCW